MTFPVRLRSRWLQEQCGAHRTKSHHKRRLQTVRQCNGASITYLVFAEVHLGDGLVYLVVLLR